MIAYVTGSIFDSTAECLVNPINCVGVMGKGLAREFKLKYPSMFEKYLEFCKNGELTVGTIAFYANRNLPNTVICLFPTKAHWKEKSTVAIINTSLTAFVKNVDKMHIKSAAFPMVGCGEGGLNFNLQVKPLLEKHLGNLDLDIEVYI